MVTTCYLLGASTRRVDRLVTARASPAPLDHQEGPDTSRDSPSWIACCSARRWLARNRVPSVSVVGLGEVAEVALSRRRSRVWCLATSGSRVG